MKNIFYNCFIKRNIVKDALIKTGYIKKVTNMAKIKNNCLMNSMAVINLLKTAFKCNCLIEVNVIDNKLLFNSY